MPTPDSRGELRQLLAIAWPLWGAQLASVALPLTDGLYMGRFDPVSLAGGGLASTLLATAILVGGSALGGMSPRVARAHAAGERGVLAAYVRHARWLGLVIAAGVMVLAAFTEPLLMAAQQEPGVARAAAEYVLPAALSVPLTLGCTIQRGLLAASGEARLVTAAWLLAVPLNLVLDHVLSDGFGPIPALGLAGIGAATSIVSLGVLVFLSVGSTQRGVDGLGAWIGPWDRIVGRDLVALGGPIVLAVAAEAGAFALAGIAVGWFGSASLAAHRVATLVTYVCFLAPLALSQAAAIRVAASKTSGEGATAARAALSAALAWALVAAIGVVVTAPTVAASFVPRHGAAFGVTVSLLHVVAAFQIADALQSVAAGCCAGEETRSGRCAGR